MGVNFLLSGFCFVLFAFFVLLLLFCVCVLCLCMCVRLVCFCVFLCFVCVFLRGGPDPQTVDLHFQLREQHMRILIELKTTSCIHIINAAFEI